MPRSYSIDVDNYLIIWILGCPTYKYVARVKSLCPLVVKVKETGDFSNLEEDDFIILDDDTVQFQEDMRRQQAVFLAEQKEKGRKVVSGLRSLSITDDKLHELVPIPY